MSRSSWTQLAYLSLITRKLSMSIYFLLLFFLFKSIIYLKICHCILNKHDTWCSFLPAKFNSLYFHRNIESAVTRKPENFKYIKQFVHAVNSFTFNLTLTLSLLIVFFFRQQYYVTSFAWLSKYCTICFAT